MNQKMTTSKSKATEPSPEDRLLSSLSSVAYATPKEPVREEPKLKNRSSQFWFKLETSAQAIERAKLKVKPNASEHIDQDIVDRVATYETDVSPAIKDKINSVREFFLMEIAPLTLASAGGAIQAKEVAQRMLDTDIDSAIFSKFDNMVNRAATIKLGLFVLSYFGLPNSYFDSLIAQGNQKSNPELQAIMNSLSELTNNQKVQGKATRNNLIKE